MVASPAPSPNPRFEPRRDSLFTVGKKARRPTFEDFPASVDREARWASPILESREARLYRTKIREAARAGANFAGHHVIALWGCGTECQQMAIVDGRGHVYVAPFVASAGVSFRRDSRLVIVNPPEATREAVAMGADPGRYFARYYRWTGSALALIDSIPPSP